MRIRASVRPIPKSHDFGYDVYIGFLCVKVRDRVALRHYHRIILAHRDLFLPSVTIAQDIWARTTIAINAGKQAFHQMGSEEMMYTRTNCGYRLAWILAGCFLLAIAVPTGCSLPEKQGSVGSLATAKQFNEVLISYRTDSDRVNLAAASYPGATQMVSFQQHSPSLLPNVTTATLQIQHPHPEGIPGYARARVVVQPNGAEVSEGTSFWGRLTGGSDEQDAANQNTQIIEVRLLDIPAWQVNGIMAKLQEQNFFRRAKALNAETFLAVKADGAGFGKDYRSVPELDALILRVRREGRPAGQPSYHAARPPRGPVQPPYDPSPQSHGPVQPNHSPPPQPSYHPPHGHPHWTSQVAPSEPPATPPMTRLPLPTGGPIW